METGRRPTGRAPLPAATSSPDAVIRVFAARTVRWRSIFAVHTWIVVKKKGATSYTRYDYTAWGEPIRTNGFAPDGRWFGAVPETVVAVDGVRAELRSCFPAWEQLTTVVTRARWRFIPIEPPCQWGSAAQLLQRTSRSYAGAPLREFARCSAIFAAVDLTNTSESSAQMCRNGATLGTKPWIAEFGLPAPSRIHVALDLYVFDTPHWTLCGS